MTTKNYLINWPNGTISIITANTPDELFWRMDEEGDPTSPDVEIYILPEYFHIGTQLIDGKIEFSNYEDEDLKRYRFSKNFSSKAFQRAYPNASLDTISDIKSEINIT
jgi:hypothetical protein